MGYDVAEAWHPWHVNSQVAGYATQYDANGFSFVTVKGAGHMVPQFAPQAAFHMFKSFINGKPL
jgi:carboxypeptidase C (cathepsin A)